MKETRIFLVALLFTALAWFFTAMEESHRYTFTVPVEWKGYDGKRYLEAQSDKQFTFEVRANGFRVFSWKHDLRNRTLMLTATGDTAIGFLQIMDTVVAQFDLTGARDYRGFQDSLRLRLTPRRRKGIAPELHKVRFEFEPPYGLYGTPRVAPDSVFLSGPQKGLDAISRVRTSPYTIKEINHSGYYSVPLDAEWKKHKGVQASVDSLRIFLPVAKYTEHTLAIPVKAVAPEGQGRVTVYPPQVEVTIWVAAEDANLLDEKMFAAEARIADAREGMLPVVLTEFPSYIRVKKVSPESLNYVFIKD